MRKGTEVSSLDTVNILMYPVSEKSHLLIRKRTLTNDRRNHSIERSSTDYAKMKKKHTHTHKEGDVMLDGRQET